MEHLDSARGLNATARFVGVSKDAVGRLLRVGGRISYQLHDRLVRDLQPAALQFDEKWSYVAKKQRHVPEQDNRSQTGDYWDANDLDPQSKLLVSLVPGCRTTDGEAIVTTFGRAHPVPRRGPRGRPPARWCISLKRWCMPRLSNIGKGGRSNRWKSDRSLARANWPTSWPTWAGPRADRRCAATSTERHIGWLDEEIGRLKEK